VLIVRQSFYPALTTSFLAMALAVNALEQVVRPDEPLEVVLTSAPLGFQYRLGARSTYVLECDGPTLELAPAVVVTLANAKSAAQQPSKFTRAKLNFRRHFNLICPVQSSHQKYSA